MDPRKLTDHEKSDLINEMEKNKDLTKNDTKRIQAVIGYDANIDEKILKQLTGFNRGYAAKLKVKFRKKGISSLISPKKKPHNFINYPVYFYYVFHRITPLF